MSSWDRTCVGGHYNNTTMIDGKISRAVGEQNEYYL